MKALIINGSPHKNGDIKAMIDKVKQKLPNDTKYEELDLYIDSIKPCIDCRYCWQNIGCAIKDKMSIIYEDDYDLLIVASPIYMYNVTPPLFSLITRLNYIWSNKHFLNYKNKFRSKQGIIILAGGGSGAPRHALEMINLMFSLLNVNFNSCNYLYSLNTNTIPAKDDQKLDELINEIVVEI
ncbi:MAG TPA: flavodoxin family protein [Bacilli bacterium]|nr:flavodoxin family protein [Bacilli bacterium]